MTLEMNEIWIDINGFDGYYQISNQGRIKSLERWIQRSDGKQNHILERIIKTTIINTGYEAIRLHKDGVSENRLVHRLVAEHFIPNPDNLPLVNHKDEDRLNNVVTNLEWADAKYNSNYGNCRKKLSEKKNRKNVSKPVLQYNKEMFLISEYPSTMEAHRVTGVLAQTIGQCCLGKLKTSGGYIWKYKE